MLELLVVGKGGQNTAEARGAVLSFSPLSGEYYRPLQQRFVCHKQLTISNNKARTRKLQVKLLLFVIENIVFVELNNAL